MQHHYFDVIIIGSGAAGLGLALSLPLNTRIAIISKSNLMAGSSNRAQGGIAAVMSQEDSFESHIEDTLQAGDGLCHLNVVEFTVKNAKKAITWLMNQGVQFTSENQQFHLNQEGGHSHRRVLHAADKTGSEVIKTLAQQIQERQNITCFIEHTAIDLSISENRVCDGALVLDNATSKYINFKAKIVVLATGGASASYLHTSNSDHTSGDGIAMAWRAGCKIANLEFNQFHPTCFYNANRTNEEPFLITEAIRGEGGILKLPNGKRFMQNYDKRAELASRDIVARAIDHEMKKNNLNFVYLDISHESPSKIQTLFPTIYNYCLQNQINICKEPIPVVPAAHYTCGGVVTNLYGQTHIPNLYAIGEVACTGLHGANRMASNSLLECVVFARSASQHIKQQLPKIILQTQEENFKFFDKFQNFDAKKITHDIRKIMWDYVGIVRNTERLLIAEKKIKNYKNLLLSDLLSTSSSVEEIELRNLIVVSDLIIQCALIRKESRGLHYNMDFPKKQFEAKDTVLIPKLSNPLKLNVNSNFKFSKKIALKPNRA